MIMNIKVFFIAVKMITFVFAMLLLTPIVLVTGAKPYLENTLSVITGYMQELVDIGYITEDEKDEFQRFLNALGYVFCEETDNPAYQLFLS